MLTLFPEHTLRVLALVPGATHLAGRFQSLWDTFFDNPVLAVLSGMAILLCGLGIIFVATLAVLGVLLPIIHARQRRERRRRRRARLQSSKEN